MTTLLEDFKSDYVGCCGVELLNVNDGIGMCPECGEWCEAEEVEEIPLFKGTREALEGLNLTKI